MHLYFLRHGIADDRSLGLPDESRRLTPEGIAKMRLEAAALVRLELKLDALYSSPYPRAYETAEIVQQALQCPPVQKIASMAAGHLGLGTLQALLKDTPSNAQVMLVGHEPDISLTVQRLTGANIEMKKGGLAYVEAVRLEPADGVLRWLLAPKTLIHAVEFPSS